MQIATIEKLGKRSWYYFGSNFDLKTGKLISIDKLVDINAKDYKESIVDVLTSRILNYNHNINAKIIEDIYGAKGKDDYMIEFRFLPGKPIKR